MVLSVRRRAVGLLLTSFSLLSACGEKERAPIYSSGSAGAEIPAERLPEASADFEEINCRGRVPGRLSQCGIVSVPMSPGSSERVEIRVARVFTASENPKDDPIVYLDGGPGGSSIDFFAQIAPIFEAVTGDRDLIFIDQRGTGASKPGLDCPNVGETAQEYIENCYLTLSERIDLETVRTAQIVQDIDAVRRAFGYEEWNLWGISYGTRVALTAARDTPEGLRSFVIDSVVPLQSDLLAEVGINAYESLERIFNACLSDDECALKYPDSMGDLLEVVRSLEAEPFESEAGVVTAGLFVQALFQMAYAPVTIELIPATIDSAKADNFDRFLELQESLGSSSAFGMHLAVQCAEEIAFLTRSDFEEYDEQVPEELRAALSGIEYLDYCDWFPVPAADAIENQGVKSDIPALVLTGRFDPITPPVYAATAATDLDDTAQYFVIENESHGASVEGCGAELARAFFEEPGAELSSSCTLALPGLDFASRSGQGAGERIYQPGLHFVLDALSDAQWRERLEKLRRRQLISAAFR